MIFPSRCRWCAMLIPGVALLFSLGNAYSQNPLPPVDEFIASDPAMMRTRITADFEDYIFFQEARYYAMRFAFDYGLADQKSLFGMSLPLVHTIFNADLGGYENTTGIGDLKMRYTFVPFHQEEKIGFQRLSTYFEVTAPTGEYLLGRGAGTWLYKPGLIFTYRTGPFVSFYPEVKFQFSTGDANSLGAGDGAPDGNEPEKDGPIQNLSLAIPFVVLMKEWRGWLSFNAFYIQSFSEDTYYVFLRTDFGKMIGQKTSAALNISKFIAGQPQVNVLVQARFQFFLR